MTMALDRRQVLKSAAFVATVVLLPAAASASPETMAAAMKQALGAAVPKSGRVKFEIAPLAENGNSVPITITVDSPMTTADHVKTIYVFSPENPQPDVVRFHLTPRSGRAKVQTSIRLATSQKIHAVAEMSDGSIWSAEADVIVTLAACLDAG